MINTYPRITDPHERALITPSGLHSVWLNDTIEMDNTMDPIPWDEERSRQYETLCLMLKSGTFASNIREICLLAPPATRSGRWPRMGF